MENTIRLSIEGMHCGACARRVTNALAAVEGVRVDSVEVGAAQVKFDAAKTTAEAITAAVDRIGFTARVNGEFRE
jgi:copper chaperone